MLHIDDQTGDRDAWRSLHDLFYRRRSPRNASQETLLLCWDAIELIHSDGFEALIEQSPSLEVYAAALKEVGLAAVVPILGRVEQLLSAAPREDAKAFWSVVHEHFAILKVLAEEFWEKSADSDQVLQQFVSDRQSDFAEYLPGTAAGA